jgi:predicted 2-oxoglutarate/Fe(II)-dependent dioxygenase YbiX
VTGVVIRDSISSAFTEVTYTATRSGGAFGFNASGSGNINNTVTMPAGSNITYKATGAISASAITPVRRTPLR